MSEPLYLGSRDLDSLLVTAGEWVKQGYKVTIEENEYFMYYKIVGVKND